MSDSDLRVFPSLEEAGRALADEVASELRRAVAERERATLALSGGSTPRGMHRVLARQHAGLPWRGIHVFWGDERFVPPNSEDSNYRMARETLLDGISILPDNVHPWPAEMSEAESAALTMQVEMERFFGRSALEHRPPIFDVILLGIGEDGHTASLFPGSPALRVEDRWTTTSEAPTEPRRRLTFTLPVLNAARHVHFLVAGESKRAAVRCALNEMQHRERCPASMVRPDDGALTWWLDEEAAP